MAARKAGLQGDLSTVRGLKKRLQSLPVTIAHDVAQRAAPAMTDETRTAFDAGRSVYGEPRPRSEVDGTPLTLVRTGAIKSTLRFVSSGRITRCVLGPRSETSGQYYGKYLIGRYGVLPNGPLPAGWSQRLAEIVKSTKDPLK